MVKMSLYHILIAKFEVHGIFADKRPKLYAGGGCSDANIAAV